MSTKSSAKVRITVTVPKEALLEAERRVRNRSELFSRMLTRQVEEWHRAEMLASLDTPHPESLSAATAHLDEETWGLPAEDIDEMVDTRAGVCVKWEAGKGWRRR